jgi:transposase-like protein
MGRKSALTPEQWIEIERRHLVDGVSINSLAKQFKVDESTIRKKINPNKSEGGKTPKPLLALASEKVEADKRVKNISAEIAELPFARQEIVNTLTTRLSRISDHMAGAAEFAAASAHRLSGIAHEQVQMIDDAQPEKTIAALQRFGALTKLANEASSIPLNLLAANKDLVKVAQKDAPTLPVKVVIQVEDASISEA